MAQEIVMVSVWLWSRRSFISAFLGGGQRFVLAAAALLVAVKCLSGCSGDPRNKYI